MQRQKAEVIADVSQPHASFLIYKKRLAEVGLESTITTAYITEMFWDLKSFRRELYCSVNISSDGRSFIIVISALANLQLRLSLLTAFYFNSLINFRFSFFFSLFELSSIKFLQSFGL